MAHYDNRNLADITGRITSIGSAISMTMADITVTRVINIATNSHAPA